MPLIVESEYDYLTLTEKLRQSNEVAQSWFDLVDRLRRAIASLNELADVMEPGNPVEATRIRHKAEGVKLALSYAHEQRPVIEL